MIVLLILHIIAFSFTSFITTALNTYTPRIIFGFKTPSNYTYGGTRATVTMTLYWNNTKKFRCFVDSIKENTEYLCDTSNTTTTSECQILNNSSPLEYALQIDNYDSDAVDIDKIIIKYIYNEIESISLDTLIDYFCLDECYDLYSIDNDDSPSPYALFSLSEHTLFDSSNKQNIELETEVYPRFCTECATGYFEQIGDIPGWGDIDGWLNVGNCDECAGKCKNSSHRCQSYECSPTDLLCNLNTQADPSQRAYEDYRFCTRGSNSEKLYIDNTKKYLPRTHCDKINWCPTKAPTKSPTKSPTAGSVKTRFLNENNETQFALSIGGSLLLLLLIVIIFTYLYIKRSASKYKTQMEIRNAMVILLAIGDFQDEPSDADVDMHLDSLELEQDIHHLSNLFGSTNLNYKIFPQYNLYPKIEWTQDEVITFLQKKAKQLNDNSIDKTIENKNKFDGLVVAVSSHGWNSKIITSDHKLISKDSIHRMFSRNYPETREIPRVFLFDCCDGSSERTVRCYSIDENNVINNKGKQIKKLKKAFSVTDTDMKVEYTQFEKGKQFSTDDITGLPENWYIGDKNPDHKLVLIHAANKGFQSKFNLKFGSYMLKLFCDKQLKDLTNRGEQCIFEIFDDIQHELEEQGKQKVITTYNDKTRYIIFKKNTNNYKENINDIEAKNKIIDNEQIKMTINDTSIEDDKADNTQVEMINQSKNVTYNKDKQKLNPLSSSNRVDVLMPILDNVHLEHEKRTNTLELSSIKNDF